MSKDLPLFRHVIRNLRWYAEDVRTSVTGKGKLHFTYGGQVEDSFSGNGSTKNPGTGLEMLTATRDVHGNRWGTANSD